MPSTINASNSGFGGIVSTGDSSGELQLQTAGTTAVTINTSQNVGIGTTSPAFRLDVSGGHARIRGAQALFWSNSDNTNAVSIYNAGSTGSTSGQMVFETSNSTERMRINSSGIVTMPYQPAFCARGDASNPSSSGAILSYSVALLNVGGHYNASTYRFTAPVAGNYRFSYNCLFNASTYLYAGLYKNATYVTGLGSIGVNQGAGVEAQSSCSVVVSANANDYFDVRIWFYSRGYVGLYADHAAFSGELIG